MHTHTHTQTHTHTYTQKLSQATFHQQKTMRNILATNRLLFFVPCMYKRHVALLREGGWVHTKCPSKVDMLKADALQAAAIISSGYALGEYVAYRAAEF